MQNRVARLGLGSACLLIGMVWVSAARGQQEAEPDDTSPTMIRDGFETPKVVWRQEQTDATVKIFAHERTNRAAHEGRLSEGFQFDAGIGGGLYFSYRLPNIPVTQDLKVGLYVRSNRSGAQILGRVVLPGDIDPDSRRPSFVLVPGTIFETADRWQKLELVDLLPAIERQAKVLRASTRRPVSLKGAYLERLVMNIYGGEGETEVYLDELTVGPVAADLARAPRGEPTRGPTVRTIADRPMLPNEPLEALPPGLNTRIKLDRNRLTKDGYPWLFTAVRAPDADPSRLRAIGCDVLVVPRDADEATVRAAIASGMLLIPELTGPADRTMPDADSLLAQASSFLGRDSVAFWSLGENLGRSIDLESRKSTLRRVRETAQAFRKARPGGSPLTTGTVSGMLPEYARLPENLDVIGIPTAGWATTQDPFEMFQFLEQRRLLTARSNADALFWATIDVMPPPIYQESIWGTDTPPSWGRPRVQPEQIRVSTFAALAAGCRGLCFQADSELTREIGRPNLIEMALLNEEIDLLEPILADPDKSIRMIPTFLPDPPPPPPVTLFQMNLGAISRPPVPKEFPPHPTIKAAAITTKDRRGTLLMVADYYKYAQYQPPQSAMNNVILRVPAASDAHAYLITPGGVQTLASLRKPGGIEITLEDFGVTAIVLVTTNIELKDQIERSVNNVRVQAVNLAIEQAELLRTWVVEIDSVIRRLGHPQKHSVDLLNDADRRIKAARDSLERFDYQIAWDEARRVGRPLRILMRYHFMAAYDAIIKDLNDEDLPCGPLVYSGFKKPKPRIIAPIVAAPLASFSTLPQAWIWYDWIRGGRLGKNLVPNGNFTDPKVLETGGWVPVSYQSDDIVTEIKLNKGGPDTETYVEPDPKDDKKDAATKKKEAAKKQQDKPKKPGSNLVLSANPKPGLSVDLLPPYFDHPMVAVRSPTVKVGARQVYRISVMAYMANQTAPGAGGLIIRDSIGGERLQFRTPNALAMDWFEIVYYRRAPADGTLNVTLGMAGTGFAAFDDFKIEPIVDQLTDEQLKLIARRKPKPTRPPAETATSTPNSGAPELPTRPPSANRLQGAPVRQ